MYVLSSYLCLILRSIFLVQELIQNVRFLATKEEWKKGIVQVQRVFFRKISFNMIQFKVNNNWKNSWYLYMSSTVFNALTTFESVHVSKIKMAVYCRNKNKGLFSLKDWVIRDWLLTSLWKDIVYVRTVFSCTKEFNKISRDKVLPVICREYRRCCFMNTLLKFILSV